MLSNRPSVFAQQTVYQIKGKNDGLGLYVKSYECQSQGQDLLILHDFFGPLPQDDLALLIRNSMPELRRMIFFHFRAYGMSCGTKGDQSIEGPGDDLLTVVESFDLHNCQIWGEGLGALAIMLGFQKNKKLMSEKIKSVVLIDPLFWDHQEITKNKIMEFFLGRGFLKRLVVPRSILSSFPSLAKRRPNLDGIGMLPPSFSFLNSVIKSSQRLKKDHYFYNWPCLLINNRNRLKSEQINSIKLFFKGLPHSKNKLSFIVNKNYSLLNYIKDNNLLERVKEWQTSL